MQTTTKLKTDATTMQTTTKLKTDATTMQTPTKLKTDATIMQTTIKLKTDTTTMQATTKLRTDTTTMQTTTKLLTDRTTMQTTTKPPTPTESSSHGEEATEIQDLNLCSSSSCVVKILKSWPGGTGAQLKIPIKEDINSFIIKMETDIELTEMKVSCSIT